MNMMPPFFGQPGQPVPAVDPEDLKVVHVFLEETARRIPGRTPPAAGVSIFQQLCKPGADLPAVSYRVMMLGLLSRPTSSNPSDARWKERLAPWTKDGYLDAAVYREFAQLPMEWMAVGVIRHDFPFDVELLLTGLKGETPS